MPREQMETWFLKKYQRSNFAVLTGKVHGVVVFDIDVGADISGLDLPDTVTVNTGGGGKHLYYRYPEGIDHIKTCVGEVRPKIDIRGDAGMAVAPPSLHKS